MAGGDLESGLVGRGKTIWPDREKRESTHKGKRVTRDDEQVSLAQTEAYTSKKANTKVCAQRTTLTPPSYFHATCA